MRPDTAVSNTRDQMVEKWRPESDGDMLLKVYRTYSRAAAESDGSKITFYKFYSWQWHDDFRQINADWASGKLKINCNP